MPRRASRPETAQGERRQPRLVVGVGASAGGLVAFRTLLEAMPADTGMAFLLVQHLDPTHESLLSELLEPRTSMQVKDANHGARLEPDTVYIIQPDTALAVKDGHIVLSEPEVRRGLRLPVDHLFRSLADEYGPRAVGVVLSGAGSDGSRGVREIRSAGGLAIAQSPESCGQAGMPDSAIATGAVDLVLEIEDVPEALARFDRLPPCARIAERTSGEASELRGSQDAARQVDEPQLARLRSLIEAHGGVDLRAYKDGTISRRVSRRMMLLGVADFDAFCEVLRTDPVERQALVRDMLIGVTEFFRDSSAYDALREQVVRPLVKRAAPGDTIRVWVAGCATGEEAYSLAMEFLDAFDVAEKRVHLQLFATDVDHEALHIGRRGVYPLSIEAQVGPQRLERYFKPLNGRGYEVRPRLRDSISFATHDLTKDPPFSRMDLVSCRNVLIYLNGEAQERVLELIHFALDSDGYLLLGTSESTGAQRGLFSTVSKPARVFQRVEAARSPRVGRAPTQWAGLAALGEERTRPRPSSPREVGPGDLARRAVVNAFAPPSLVVAADGAVLFSHGDLEPYLRMPSGDHPRFELDKIVRQELAPRVRAVLHGCRRSGEATVALSSPEGWTQQIEIGAEPARGLGDGDVVLYFRPVPSTDAGDAAGPRTVSAEQDALAEQLERELQATREDLRSTVEQLETSNEELRSSNEESMSMNEELQSANEELEASTEELRSLNEELTTVNAQLREKIDQIEQAHDDLSNFFSSTKIATLFLDEALRVKRFTPAARELLGVDHGDVGRDVGSFARDLLQSDLSAESQGVLESLNSRNREMRLEDGRWFNRSIHPYKTESRRIEGVVVTYVEVTELKRTTARLVRREYQQSVVARLGTEGLRESTLQAFLDRVVHDVQDALDVQYCKVLELQPGERKLLLRSGVGWAPGIAGRAVVDAGENSQAGFTLHTGGAVVVADLREERRFSGPSLLVDHGVVSGLSCTIRAGDRVYGVLGAHTRDERSFADEDVLFLQAVAALTGAVIGQHEQRLRIALELATFSAIAESDASEPALSRVLEALCTTLSASACEVWWAEEHGDSPAVLRRGERHAVDGREAGAEPDRNAPSECEPGVGFVGRVYAEARSRWESDVDGADRESDEVGIGGRGYASGLGLPIRSGDRLLGVVAIYSRTRLLGGGALLGSLDVIGRAVAEFLLRTRAIETLRMSERRFQMVADNITQLAWTCSTLGVATWYNRRWCEFTGMSEEQMLGTGWKSVMHPDHIDRVVANLQAAIEADEPWEDTFPIRSAEGEFRWFLSRAVPIRDEGGRTVAWFGTNTDITQLREVREELLDANRQKDQFLAVLGHELRNPLAAIRSACDLLHASGSAAGASDENLAVIDRQSAHMARLLDGLLDISRMIHGKVRLDRTVVDLAEVCRVAVEDARRRADDLSLRIVESLPEGGLNVEGDGTRLAQIVDNILTNAIKYTPSGGAVTVELRESGSFAELRVSDTGVGMDPELLSEVFEPFSQASQTLDRSLGGLGLGLALVKLLVEMHGGTVEARSEGVQKGSEFVVLLPTTDHERRDVGASSDVANVGRRILLIEDNVDAARTLAQLLQLHGHEVHIAPSGGHGLELARDREFELVLCDLGLPGGMSGYEVAVELRRDHRTRHLHLIALTGYGRLEDQQRTREVGFDRHMTKPVDVQELLQLLGRSDLSDSR